ncbi:hypothetical protein PENSPDRAFT_692466 [Peniophora sp. CONT]|nr:hypothetical protein PENSPDRAFT_692466 [Peniophora sp. CONT]
MGKDQRSVSGLSPSPGTSIISLFEILVVLGLSLALSAVCRLLRYPVPEDRYETRADHCNDLSSRCLSIIHALQSDSTLSLPAKALLDVLSFIFIKLDLTDSAIALTQASPVPSGGSESESDSKVTTGYVQHRKSITAAPQDSASSQPTSPSPKLGVPKSTEESCDSDNSKLSKAARRRRNRKARLAPYLKPAPQAIDPLAP